MALFSTSDASPINIGSGDEISIKNLALLIRELKGGSFDIIWDTSKSNGQPRRVLDIQLAKDELSFNPSIPIREGLKKTIDFYRDNY